MYLTSLERFHAALTETYGSYPYTSIPSAIAALATNCPIAPRPITPSFLPLISCPANAFLAFSVALAISGSSALSATHLLPPIKSLDAKSIAAITCSLTALALAPGVLNTTIPSSAHLSRGILLTPAPALAIARRLSLISISCILALLTSTACASSNELSVLYSSEKSFKPHAAILLRQLTLIIMHSPSRTSS